MSHHWIISCLEGQNQHQNYIGLKSWIAYYKQLKRVLRKKNTFNILQENSVSNLLTLTSDSLLADISSTSLLSNNNQMLLAAYSPNLPIQNIKFLNGSIMAHHLPWTPVFRRIDTTYWKVHSLNQPQTPLAKKLSWTGHSTVSAIKVQEPFMVASSSSSTQNKGHVASSILSSKLHAELVSNVQPAIIPKPPNQNYAELYQILIQPLPLSLCIQNHPSQSPSFTESQPAASNQGHVVPAAIIYLRWIHVCLLKESKLWWMANSSSL
jgi:hypothetical protein